ncbi:acyl carrier protein [Streptomyces sp. TLI_053]|uniref:acyl carrier protein n=1 Tax=Streptomyces sp. TLI_053 TaxID=1855352 RepID=UPI0008795D18|nr:acyl carrier protein [Streptomyces sp. TLI_053]SDT83425.1 acyl carrier protein [Streptomyces sp. TLI_053]
MKENLSALLRELGVETAHARPEDRLEAIGVDSLTIAELSLVLRERTGADIGEDALAAATTIGQLERLVGPHLDMAAA